MNLIFKKITLHNFGCYEHAELSLQNKGFCAVTGKNNFKKDCSLSNGSGKSMLWSAICFALTGETIKGVKSQLKNRYNDANDSYVELVLTADNDEFVIKRIIAPKSDLTLIKNDADISGKGIRESEKKLSEVLPDLTKDLIASTIIIGQGMPNKFSSFSPVGRKELLEKLTKSDYMIDEIKQKLSARQLDLAKNMREYDDAILVANTQLNTLSAGLTNARAEFNAFTFKDYDSLIAVAQTNIAALTQQLADATLVLKKLETKQQENNNLLTELANLKSTEVLALNKNYTEAKTPIVTRVASITATIKAKEADIKRLEAIKDVCPTCGHKLDGVTKPDTTALHKEVAELQADLTAENDNLAVLDQKYSEYTAGINDKFYAKTESAKLEATKLINEITAKQLELDTNTHKLTEENTNLYKLTFDKDNDSKKYLALQEAIKTAEENIKKIIEDQQNICRAKEELQQHVDVVKKIETLVKRDFRGYLLTNIIEFLDKKAKEYSEVVYGTQDLNVYIDGNALDITYCNKNFDNLSGGEQQRVDLILQFAIRDLLSTYLGYSSNILVLDEIFDNLDKVATEKVLELITTKLSDIESLFIISHHSDSLEIGYDYTINVTKNEDGISEVTE